MKDDRTALQQFADWMKPVAKNEIIKITSSDKVIIFERTGLTTESEVK